MKKIIFILSMLCFSYSVADDLSGFSGKPMDVFLDRLGIFMNEGLKNRTCEAIRTIKDQMKRSKIINTIALNQRLLLTADKSNAPDVIRALGGLSSCVKSSKIVNFLSGMDGSSRHIDFFSADRSNVVDVIKAFSQIPEKQWGGFMIYVDFLPQGKKLMPNRANAAEIIQQYNERLTLRISGLREKEPIIIVDPLPVVPLNVQCSEKSLKRKISGSLEQRLAERLGGEEKSLQKSAIGAFKKSGDSDLEESSKDDVSVSAAGGVCADVGERNGNGYNLRSQSKRLRKEGMS